ncbi:hypothetical protein C8R44DRAFT_909448 [Mycena epipterygia]|nr:hypothetical protein C8R44DRAFT_909448 [Mycena epipterygia]
MLVLVPLLLALLSSASPILHHPFDHDHEHTIAKRLPSTWYHADDHSAPPFSFPCAVHSLFKRGGTDGITYADVGSPEWTNAYPPGPPAIPDVNSLPAEWTAALNDAIARNVIPDIPVATNIPNENPVYPTGSDPNSPEICSATYGCRINGDIWDAPDGYIGIAFDDGPQPASDALLSFLQANNQSATHFMIGSNIIWYPTEFQKAFAQGDDIAVHTWTHPHMTTQTNLQVVAELGWTMELIHNSTGGRVPKFWRPPYGDSDVRTRAIAKEVFGLTTIIWNHDTADWTLTVAGGTTPAAINASMTQWLTGSKSPGLIMLEHELSDQSVDAFKAGYPVMQQNKWNLESLARLMGNGSAYINAASDTSPVNAVDILGAKNALSSSASASSSASVDPASAGSPNT